MLKTKGANALKVQAFQAQENSFALRLGIAGVMS